MKISTIKSLFGMVIILLVFPMAIESQEISNQWQNQESFTIFFNIIGEANPNIAAHIVRLAIDTNGSTPSDFDLTIHGSATSINITEGSLPYSNDTGTTLIRLNKSASVYTLEIERKPDTPPGGTFATSEEWKIELSGLPSSNTVDVDIENENRAETTVTTNYVDLNIPPTAVITTPASNQIINVGDSVNFTGTVTDDDSASLVHDWDFDGGAADSALEDPGSTTFSTAGTYVITYTVTDDIFQFATDTVTITVDPTPTDNPPTGLIIIGSSEGISPLDLTFDGSTSTDDNGISNYEWDFGDGTTDSGAALDSVSHTFLTGEYNVTLTVSDASSQTDTAGVTVKAYPNQELSFPPHRGVPYAPDPPLIDGEIIPEEWRGTQRITYSTGAAPADVAFQSLKHRTDPFIYLAFEVKKDQAFDAEDLIVLTFRPDASSTVTAYDRKLFIFPFGAAHAAGDNQDLDEIRIWKDSDGWPVELTQAEVSGIGIVAKLKSHIYATHEAWDIEMKIPTSAVTSDWVNFSDNFLFYFNVNKVNSVLPPVGPVVSQFVWPVGVPVVTGDILTYDFEPEWWGRGNKSGTSVQKGVYVERADFGTTNTPISKILLPNTDPGSVTNTFFATIKNDSEMETVNPPDYSVPVIAEDVRVRFRIANWGIPTHADWIDLPATTGIDPGAPPGISLTTVQDIPAAAGGIPGDETFNMTWTINRPGQDYTDYSGSTHQCMLVEIDSTSNTTITKRSEYRNMNFGYASEFSQEAEISVRGFGKPPSGEDEHSYLLVITPRDMGMTVMERPDPTHKVTDESSITAIGNIEWSAHGFLYTDEFVTIRGKKFEILNPVGSFGHKLTHVGKVVDWKYEIDGARKVAENLYIVGVPEESSVSITPKIWPREFYPFSISLHAGTVTPIDTLANNYSTGFTVFMDLGWQINKQFIMKMFSGINWFPPGSGSGNYWNFSTNLDIRYLLPIRGNLLPFVQAGPGIYYDDSGSVNYGVNSGMGISYKLNSRLSLELGVDYHVTMDPVIQFMTAYGGVVFKF